MRAARAAGARTIWASVVHLRPGVREHFLEALARDWPEEVARYEALFASRAYLERGDDEPDPRTRAAKRRSRPEPAQASAAHRTRVSWLWPCNAQRVRECERLRDLAIGDPRTPRSARKEHPAAAP